MNKSVLLTLLFAFLALNSCFIFDSKADKIIGDYEVIWIDTPKSRAVCKRFSSTGSTVLIHEYIFAVGHNSDFIIAKQHPSDGFENGYNIDTTKTNYYILDIKNDGKVFGPYNQVDFKKETRRLNIDDLSFDQTYPSSI